MQLKQLTFQKLWHSNDWVDKNVVKTDEFDYSGIDRLELFDESHPELMKERIQRLNWVFTHDISKNKINLKERVKDWMWRYLGINTNYRNYKILK